MLEIKQTSFFMKWERALKDRRARAAIAARIFRLANGLPGDVAPVGQGERWTVYGVGFTVQGSRFKVQSAGCEAGGGGESGEAQ